MGRTNSVLDLLDNTLDTDRIDFSGFNNLETTVAIVVIVTGSTQCRTNTSMDIRVISQQALLRGMVEIRSVVNACHFAWAATKDLWFPRVKMRIKVDNRDRPVGTVNRTQQGKGDRVVTTKGNDTGKSLAIFSRAGFLGIGGRRSC